MKTRVIQVSPTRPQPDVVQQACEVLRRGGLVAFPTDTLYAIGGLVRSARAAARVNDDTGQSPGSIPTAGNLPKA